jgi:hypothetical protein
MESDDKLNARCAQRQNTFWQLNNFFSFTKKFRTKISFCRPALMASSYLSEFCLAFTCKIKPQDIDCQQATE